MAGHSHNLLGHLVHIDLQGSSGQSLHSCVHIWPSLIPRPERKGPVFTFPHVREYNEGGGGCDIYQQASLLVVVPLYMQCIYPQVKVHQPLQSAHTITHTQLSSVSTVLAPL